MLLSIDLGANLGWVLRDAVGPIRFGTIQLDPTTNLGRHLRSMDEPICQLLRLATSVAVEKPNTGGESAYFAIRKNMAALGHLAYWADYLGLPRPKEISVNTGKLTLSGFGHADKDMMIAAAKRLYDLDMNEHEADALGISEVFLFGAREPINKRRSRSSKATIIKPGEADQ